jgi:hypothetical protein
MATLCVATLYVMSGLAQSNSQHTIAPNDRLSIETLAELQRDVSQIRSDLSIQTTSQAQPGTAEKLAKLQRDVTSVDERLRAVENQSRPAWVLGIPWVALSVVGLAFAWAWCVVNRQQQVLKFAEQALRWGEQALKVEDHANETRLAITALMKNALAALDKRAITVSGARKENGPDR